MGCLASKEEPLDFKADSATPVAPAAPAAPVTAANVEDVVPPCRVIEVLGGGNLKKTEPAAGAESAPTVIVIDPRCPANLSKADFSEFANATPDNLMIFLLLPSATPSKTEYMLNAEVGVFSLPLLDKAFPPNDNRNSCLRLVRIDEFYEQGVAKVATAFLANKDAKIYGDKEAMLALFEPRAQYGYKNKAGETVKEAALWFVSCWYDRAFAVSAAVAGVEDGSVKKFINETVVPTLQSGAVCEAPKDVPSVPKLHIVRPSGRTPKFYNLSGSASDTYEMEGGAFSMQTTLFMPDNFPDPEENFPVIMMRLEDLKTDKTADFDAMKQFKEERPNVCLTVVLAFDIDQARANDETNPLEDMFWLMAMHKLLDSADLVVFVKSGKGAHISDVVSAFNNVKVAKPKEHLGKLLLQQMVPFPRLKFIFIGTTLDIPMEDGEIIGSAITVGTGLNNIPPEKFMSGKSKWRPLSFTVGERHLNVPAAKNISFVAATEVFKKVMDSMMPKEETWGDITWPKIGEAAGLEGDAAAAFGADRKPEEIAESLQDMKDLMKEYDTYGHLAGTRFDEPDA